MKTIILSFLLFFSFSSLVFSQKKYVVRIKTLDNHVHKGLLFQVKEDGILIFPNKFRWDFKILKNNISKTKFIDFGAIKNIKIKKKDNVPFGAFIGAIAGATVGIILAKQIKIDPYDFAGLGALGQVSTFSRPLMIGIVLGSGVDLVYPHIYNVKNDSVSIQNLTIKLRKYEFYKLHENAVKDTTIH